MIVVPVFAAVVEAQNKSRLHRWLGDCYVYGWRRASKYGYLLEGGLYSTCIAHIKKKIPTPVWATSTAERGGGSLFLGGYSITYIMYIMSWPSLPIESTDYDSCMCIFYGIAIIWMTFTENQKLLYS